MDTTSYLLSQGWAGQGHPLTKHKDGRGLIKPILVSRKPDNGGIGKKKHDFTEQWWLKGFEDGLKGLDVLDLKNQKVHPKEEEVVVVQRKEKAVQVDIGGTGVRARGNGGLYEWFTRGEGLRGTIDVGGPEGMQQQEEEEVAVVEAEETNSKKRKRRKDDNEDIGTQTGTMEEVKPVEDVTAREETKEERRERRRKRREAKARKTAGEDISIQGFGHDDCIDETREMKERRKKKKTKKQEGQQSLRGKFKRIRLE